MSAERIIQKPTEGRILIDYESENSAYADDEVEPNWTRFLAYDNTQLMDRFSGSESVKNPPLNSDITQGYLKYH